MKLFIIFIIEKLKEILNIKVVFGIPKNVYLNEDSILDIDLKKSVKINMVTYDILRLLNYKNNIDDITCILLKKYNVSRVKLEKDIEMILSNLQDKNLIEYRFIGNKIVTYVFNLIIGQYLYKKRYSIPESKTLTFLLLLYIIIKKLFLMWVITIIPILIFINNFFLDFNKEINYAISCYFILIFGTIFSFTLHEWLHIVVSKIQNKGFNGYILEKRFTVSIVKNSSESRLLATLLGPFIPSLIGVFLICIAFNIKNTMIFSLGVAFIINIINLLPFTKDGKSIIEKLIIKSLTKKEC